MILIDTKLLRKTQEEVTRLNEEIKKLHKKYDEVRAENAKLRPAHDYYMLLQKAAMDDEAVMNAFQQLMLLIRLSSDEEIDGVTRAG